MRSWLWGALALAVLLIGWAAAERWAPAREAGPAAVGPEVEDGALRPLHPEDNAVWPVVLGAPTLRWAPDPGGASTTALLRAAGRSLEVSGRAGATLDTAAFTALVEGVDAVELQLRRSTADGRVTRGPTTRLRLAGPERGPTGMILAGYKHAPPGTEAAATPLLNMHLAIVGVSFEAPALGPRVIARSSYGPEPFALPPLPPGERGPSRCVSCHDVAPDGRHIAVFSQTELEAPGRFEAPNGFLTVLRMPERQVVAQVPHGFMPAFHPVEPGVLALATVEETIGAKTQMLLPRGDIETLRLDTGATRPVSGASSPEHVENLPVFSPDGGTLTFIRAPAGEAMHGSEGLLDIVSVPWNGGEGGAAVPVLGASQNGVSNFYPTYTPDGRWLVFTRAERGFFSQISSDLWIVPAGGGEARRLDCSSPLADTVHRLDPTGRWLAFVSNRADVRSPGVYLAAFDAVEGNCAPAVELPGLSGPGVHVHHLSWSAAHPWFAEGGALDALGDPDLLGVLGPGPHGPPPPEVQAALDTMVAARRAGDGQALRALFISPEEFRAISDCGGDEVLTQVLQGRDQLVAHVSGRPSAGQARFGPVAVQEVAVGEKPGPCRARVALGLIRMSWAWSAGGAEEQGELHLLRVDGRWRFTRM
ncbi:MAG: PD40 domain-containing protein [Deltaproteobacteria bacterium]|nr:PD40 domain-containing protein [Deltaproteobacteria bacterium]